MAGESFFEMNKLSLLGRREQQLSCAVFGVDSWTKVLLMTVCQLFIEDSLSNFIGGQFCKSY